MYKQGDCFNVNSPNWYVYYGLWDCYINCFYFPLQTWIRQCLSECAWWICHLGERRERWWQWFHIQTNCSPHSLARAESPYTCCELHFCKFGTICDILYFCCKSQEQWYMKALIWYGSNKWHIMKKSVNSYSKSKPFTLINIAKCTEANFQIQRFKITVKSIYETHWKWLDYK